ncbi:MAG TPA: glutathione S-transferase family protein [Gaiellaceae bacterium]|nr:glutathione S-transferase family protein [Gaiellaceae bacterium]
MRLIDAPRCPYCARARIALAEKGLSYETVEIDLADRPDWLYKLNPSGRVPVLDDDFVLPESAVIMEYLEERYPDPPLLPNEPRDRARARLLVFRFDESLGAEYYAFRRGEPNELHERLAALEVGQSLFADIAYAPWVIRARDMLGVDLPPRLEEWLGELTKRPSIAAEVDLVGTL